MKNYKLSIYLVIFLNYSLVSAEPYIPQDENVVLHKVKYSKINNSPVAQDNLDGAIEKAFYYMGLARQHQDPRFYGLAEAAVRLWWNKHNLDIFLLKAMIYQFNHDFKNSNIELNKLLTIDNNHDQALLIRANNYFVTGRYEKSLTDCENLSAAVNKIIKTTCRLSILGLINPSANVTSSIQNTIAHLYAETSLNKYEKLWVIGVLSHVLMVNEQDKLAEYVLGLGVQLEEDDVYVLSLYADLMYKQKRFAEIQSLLSGKIHQLPLLVRLVMAEKQLSTKSFTKNYDELIRRFQEESMRDSGEHLREKVMFELFVNQNYDIAFDLAKQNWKSQKELIDYRLLYISATRVGNLSVLEEMDNWVRVNKFSESVKRVSRV